MQENKSQNPLEKVDRLATREEEEEKFCVNDLGRREDPRSRLAGIFPPHIARPSHGVKLLGGLASVDFDFCNELVMKRLAKTIGHMDVIAKINDPQCELLLLRSCAGIYRLYFTMCTCPPRVFESAQCSFDVALCSFLECIVTTSEPGFGDWQWRLATLPFAFGGLGVYSAGDVLNYAFLASRLQSAGLQTKLLRHTGIVSPRPIFDDTLSVFNISMETDLLSNPTLWTSQWEDHTSVWLRTVPISGLGQTMNAGKEVDIGLDRGRDKLLRPADMLLYSWDGGLDVCVDLTGSSPLTQTGMVDFVPGWVVIDVAQRAVTLLKRIRKFSMTQDIRARAAIHIFNRISFAIAKGVGDHIISRLPSNLLVLVGDIYGDHAISCAGIVGIKHRHNIVHDTLVDICFRSGISAGKEVDIGLGGGREKPFRPADMLLYSWDGGLDVCVDLTGSSPLTQTGMIGFTPGRAVIEAALRKRVKYEAKCANIGYGFLPFSFSSFEELEKDAVTLLKRIRRFSVTQDIGARTAIHIFNRIDFAIARGVGAQIVSSLPTNFL
ncbi:hypothetical protein Tco_1406278 [Tanacetum coccineum]